MIRLQQKFEPSPDAVDTELNTKELVLLHLGSKSYYSLNLTGMRVWQGLKEGLSLGEISGRLQREFEVDAARSDAGVVALAEVLAKEKLVHAVD